MQSPTHANRSHRGEAVVHDVLDATRGELARVGYRALRIEDVATKANVNRTTVYRRWPTKVDLVRDTLRMMFDAPLVAPDTGSFRGDLLAIAHEMMRFLTSANGQVLVRMLMAEGAEPELRVITQDIRREKDVVLETIFDRAKSRGELRRDVRREVLMSALVGSVHHRVFALCVPHQAIDLEEHIDLLLDGALVRGPAPSLTSR